MITLPACIVYRYVHILPSGMSIKSQTRIVGDFYHSIYKTAEHKLQGKRKEPEQGSDLYNGILNTCRKGKFFTNSGLF